MDERIPKQQLKERSPATAKEEMASSCTKKSYRTHAKSYSSTSELMQNESK